MTKYDIWNAALALLPHDRRVSETEPDTTEFRRCQDAWDESRRRVLAAHDWGWAMRSLPLHGGVSAHAGHAGGWTFPRPPDALRVVGCFGADGRRVRADAKDGMFFAKAPAAELRYIPDLGGEDDEDGLDLWPAFFTEAVICELAARIAPTVTGEANQRLDGMAAQRLAEAKKLDSSEVAWSGTDGKTFARARR